MWLLYTIILIQRVQYALFSCVYIQYNISMYMYVCFSQNWSKLETSGKRPPAREDHAACYIPGPTPGQRPTLMVVGGCDSELFSDVWLLDFTNGSWSEVIIL